MPTAPLNLRILSLTCLLACASTARADAPLVSGWLEIKVSSCTKETFGANGGRSGPDAAANSHTTAVVRGIVTRTGAQPYDESMAHLRLAAAQAVQRLPKVGEKVTVALPTWDQDECRALKNATERFNDDHLCDVSMRTGSCLPPLRLVTRHRQRVLDQAACHDVPSSGPRALTPLSCALGKVEPR